MVPLEFDRRNIGCIFGAYIGSRFVKKITMRTIQPIVGVLLLLAIALGVGLV